ncbi:MAG TPA: hypothetical protein VMG10_10875 [Gemmataceae bacterium]|nr:hypothetical protein [Gemmataceae bacterium]
MSLFDFPRIHVWGTQEVNAGTGNNDSASPGAELTVTSDTARVRAQTRGMTDDRFRRWMMSLDKDGMLRAQWNYFGNFSFRFQDVRVRSVQLDHDKLVTDARQEPLIGAPVHLHYGILIDTNPEGYHTSQVFCESLEVRSPDALAGAGVFLSRKPTRATTRWLNWYRNVSYHGRFGLPPAGADGKLSSGGAGGASATFQCGIEVKRKDLEPVPHQSSDAGVVRHRLLARKESPAVTALVEALRHPKAKGLLFRYNLYLCFPHISDTELASKYFARDVHKMNPAIGWVLGTLTPWYEDEPTTITLGRYLKPATSFVNPYRPDKPYYLSPCVAVVDADSKRICLDAANCLPEDGPEGHKYSLGDVTLGIRQATQPDKDPSTNTNPVLPIGTLRNDRETYRQQGGIYDVSYEHLTPEQQALLDDDGQELVLQTTSGGVLLCETEYMVESDCSCNYLDELPPDKTWDDEDVRQELHAQPSLALRGEVDLYVRRRGKLPTGPTTLRVEQWMTTPTGFTDQYGVYRYPVLLGTETLTLEGAKGRLRLRPSQGAGMRMFRLVPPGLWPQRIAPDTLAALQFQEFFVDVRVLPYDDYSQLSDEQLTWERIYDEIFRYYSLILPAMSEYLDVTDASIWETPTAARYVMRMTDPKLWDYYNYMPRTRDLSKYRRELLWRFCCRVLEKHGVQSRMCAQLQREDGEHAAH